MFDFRAFVVTTGLVLFCLGLLFGYAELTREVRSPGAIVGVFITVTIGGLITLVGLWARRK